MSGASQSQPGNRAALSDCCNACDVTCCPSGACASTVGSSSTSITSTNPRSAMSHRPSPLNPGSALRILWSSWCDPKAPNYWPRLHLLSLFEMYCPLWVSGSVGTGVVRCGVGPLVGVRGSYRHPGIKDLQYNLTAISYSLSADHPERVAIYLFKPEIRKKNYMCDLANKVLNIAQQLGASYADVRVVERTTEGIDVKNGRVEGISSGTSSGFNVRVIVDGAWGFASSANMDDAEADRVAKQAIRIARASALVAGEPVRLSPLAPQHGFYRTPMQKDPFSIPLNQKVQLLLDADAAMRSVQGVALTNSNMEYSRERKLFTSSEGGEVEQELYDIGAAINASAVDPTSSEIQTRSYPNSFGRPAGSSGYEFIEAMNLADHGARIGEEAVKLLAAPQCPSGVTTIILDGPQTALQVHESCGHPIELDRVLGMEAGFVGKSFLTTDKLNGHYRYGSDVVNLTADATIKGG